MSLNNPRKKSKAKSSPAELELFRQRLIQNVDQKFSQFCINSPEEYSPGHVCQGVEMDDREVAQLKWEYERLQRELAVCERERRRTEFFEVLPIKTCNSNQFLHVRNERLATTLNDIGLLFVVDSDNESVFSDDTSYSRSIFNLSSLQYGVQQQERQQQSILKHSRHYGFGLKIKNFFKCW